MIHAPDFHHCYNLKMKTAAVILLPQPFFAHKNSAIPIYAGRQRNHAEQVSWLMPRQPAHSLLGSFPMTGFRRVWSLRIYSGGTVPDFHRISYSLLSLNGFSSTQAVSICHEDGSGEKRCQSEPFFPETNNRVYFISFLWRCKDKFLINGANHFIFCLK